MKTFCNLSLVFLLVLPVVLLTSKIREKRLLKNQAGEIKKWIVNRGKNKDTLKRILSSKEKIKDALKIRLSEDKIEKPVLREGDMIETERLVETIKRMKDGTALLDTANGGVQWRDGIVPFKFQSGMSYSTKKAIRDAMKEIEKESCIRFKDITYSFGTEPRGFIDFFKGDGCYSYVGHQGSKGQKISIGRGCEYKGIVIHEIMHALGFFHEQSRLDRDKYIRVNYQNINRNYWRQFDKYRPGEASTLNAKYDLKSIMHYGSRDFSKNGKLTIEARDPKFRGEIGQRKGLSKIDIEQLNRYYKCPKTPDGKDRKTTIATTTTTIKITTTARTTTTGRTSLTCESELWWMCDDLKHLCGVSAWTRKKCRKECGFCRCEDLFLRCTQDDCENGFAEYCQTTCNICDKK